MKKFTFLLFSLLAICSYGQVNIDVDFTGGLPAGWTDTYDSTTTQSCSGTSFRDNIFTAAGGNMTTSNQVGVSNGTDVTYSIDYKIVNWSAATVPTADGWGSAALQYSINNGTNWITAGTLDDSNDSNSNVCTTFSVTIPGASVPASSDLRFRILNTWAAGDYYFYIDNFYANQVSATPPNCDSSLTSATTDFAIDGTLTWNAATGGGPTGYKISVGSSMGGTDIANNVDLGATTSYTPAGLSYSTTYYTTITPYNVNGDATGCTEQSFIVEDAPPLGTDCNSPIDASSLPYTAIGETTAGFGDDYSGSPGASGCGSTSAYLNGDDIVYAHTASADGSIDVNLTNIGSTYTGVFIYNDCADIGTACAAGDVNGSSTADLSISNFAVTNGSTYYIVVSTWATPQTTSYDLAITTGATCVDVSGLTLDSSTAASATISWTPAGSETNWEIAVQADGTGTPGAGDNSGTNTTTNPHTQSGLTANTAYEVYVRAECTIGSDFGGWVGPLDFTTACATITVDYTADMTTNVPDACWEEAGSGEVAAGPGSIGFSDWDDNRNYNGTVSNSINLYAGNTDREWLLSPSFDVTGAASEIVVEVAVTDYASSTNPATMGSDDEVQLLSSIDSGVTWTVMTTWNVGNQPDVAGTTFTAALPSSSNIQFAIWASDGTVDNTEDYDFHIGAFQVRDIPACPDITGLTIDSFTAETAEISWTAGGSETGWEVLVQADGTGSPELGTPNPTINNPYSATGLTELTAYEVYVRADCSGTPGAWLGPVDFTTTALCPDVSGITIDSFTNDSVTASWTAGGTETDWEIIVQADGAGTPGGSGTATTTNPHTESGLTGNTDYEFWVRADCTGASNGYSEWVGPAYFTTACDAVTAFPYLESFEGITSGQPNCWSVEGTTTTSTYHFSSYVTGSSGRGMRFNSYFNPNTRTSELITPTIDASALSTLELKFQYKNPTAGDFEILVSSNGGTTYTSIATGLTGQTEWTEVTYDISSYISNDVLVKFKGTSNYGSGDAYIYLDEVLVRETPACPDLTDISITYVTADEVGFTYSGSGPNYEVVVQAAGTGTPALANDTGINNSSTAFIYPGLDSATTYEIYVRGECTLGSEYSSWFGPINFTTLCDTITSFPFQEGFESGVPPTCWSTFRGANGEGTVYDWTTSTTANTGSGAAYVRYENVANEAEDWLVTPAFDLSALSNPELSFYSRDGITTDYGSEFTIRVSTTDTDIASFTTIETYSEFDNLTYQQLTVDLSAYNSDTTVYIAFVLTNDDGDSFYVDDVLVWDNVPTTFTYTSGTWTPFNPMGIASSDDDIVVAAGDFVLNADMACDRFDVLPGASLTIDSGVTLTTSDLLQLQSSSTSYSSLILDGTVTGSILYDRHVNINGSGTTGSNDLISAPLTGQAFSALAAGNPNILNNGTLYLFGPFEKNTGQYVNWAGTETATLDAGVGYRAATSDNSVVTFSGTAENGTITNDIINGGTNNEEWNLVGNPYPSYLNVQDFLSHDVGGLTNLQLFDTPTAGIYGYDGSALNGWTIYNLANITASTVMAPGQGFMVSANAANTGAYDLEFSPDMRRTGNGDDFIVGRNAALTYLTINVSANSKSYTTDFYFNANASQGFDLGYDANVWGDTAPDFAIYSHLVQDNVGEPVALQTLSQTDLNDVTIALGVNANQGEQITFSIADMTLPASVNVYLEDVVANTITLLNDSDYVFTPNTDLSGTGRFFLRTSEDALSTIDNSLDKLDIFTLKASDELVVSGQLSNNTLLNLYDTQGRLVLSTKLDHTLLQNRINVSSINSGVYIVTVLNNSQEKTKKVIIN